MTDRAPRPPCPSLPPEDLVAWLDGELPAADAARVSAHARACAACAREADLLRRTGELAKRLPGLVPSAGFPARVAARVAEDHVAENHAAPRPAGRVLRFPRWAAVAAAVLVVAAGTWTLTRDRPGGGATGALTSREEEEIARDLYVLAHLDTLSAADAAELAEIADDLDAIEAANETAPENGG